MRKKIAAGAILALALGLAPLAAHADECPPPAQEQDQTIPASMAPAGRGDLYLDQETTGIWEESNGLEGLQTAPYTCEEVTTPADTLQAPPALPAPPAPPELPVP